MNKQVLTDRRPVRQQRFSGNGRVSASVQRPTSNLRAPADIGTRRDSCQLSSGARAILDRGSQGPDQLTQQSQSHANFADFAAQLNRAHEFQSTVR